MRVQGIAWAGTRTDRWSETVEMFGAQLGLRRSHELPGIAVFACDNGDTIEVFTTDEPEHLYFTTGPVRAELEAAGTELLGPIQRGGGLAWQHFRGADGNVWELTARDE